MFDVVLDALLDSLKVLGVAFILYIVLSFFEDKIARSLKKKSRLSPLFGSAIGIVPQCGLGVVATDMFQKHHITIGTLTSIYLVCSDEALPILITSGKTALSIIPILGVKFVVGFLTGYLMDLIYHKTKKEVIEHEHDCDHHLEEDIHIGCCNHPIEDEHESGIHKHLLHPLLHSLKIFIYVFVINLLFGFIVYFVTEEALSSFLDSNKYLAPLLSTIVGMIPNCAASVLITEGYLLDHLSLGACIAGLCMNAGLGFVFLFKKKESIKSGLIILCTMFVVSIIVGYVFCLCFGF